MEDGQRGGGTAWLRRDGRQLEEPERTEVFAFVFQGVRVRACVCAGLRIPAGSAHPGRLRSARAARGLPARPSISCPACPTAMSRPACPTALPCPHRCLARAVTGSGCRPGSAGAAQRLCRTRGRRGRLWLCLVGLCLPAAEGPGPAGLQEGRCEPKSCRQQRWHVGNVPCCQPGAAPEQSLLLGEKEKGRVGREPLRPSPCWGGGGGKGRVAGQQEARGPVAMTRTMPGSWPRGSG